MTIRTKDEMYNEIDTKIPDNSVGSVTPALTRSVMKDMFDTSKWRSFTSLSASTPLDQDIHNGVIADDSGGNLIFTLPDNATNSGALFGVLKASSSTNTITINPAGSDTINGDNTLVFDAFGEFVSVLSDGAGKWYIVNRNLPTFETIELDATGAELPPYKAGQLAYDPKSLTNTSDTGITGVRVQIGQELHWLVYNDTALTIANGKPVYASGVDVTEELLTVDLADASSFFTSAQILGFSTHDIPPNTIGLVTYFGQVSDTDTSMIPVGGVIYLGTTPGGIVSTAPKFPNQAIILGSGIKSDAVSGKIQVSINNVTRNEAVKSYSYISKDTVVGTNYVAGFYDAPSTDANLDEGSTSVTYGNVGNPYNAHAFIVPSAAGVVATGQVGLAVTGATFNEETGVLNTSDSDLITDDITTLTANTYFETSKKFVGQITFLFLPIGGGQTTYSLDFNYGYAKYEDFGNRDLTVTGIECVGMGRDGDTGFNIELLHHKTTGWAYSPTAFEPGNGDIANMTADIAPYDNIIADTPFAWKRTSIDQFIEGSGSEGILYRITTTSNRAVLRMDMHITGLLESN